MPTVRFNATGRWMMTGELSDNHPLNERITNHGIMDKIEFTEDEIRELIEVSENLHSASAHWLNTKLRLKRALREVADA
jgi:hypothetical protein